MRIEPPLLDELCGRRVKRVPAYQEHGRSSAGVIIGFFHATDVDANRPSRERTHLRILFDDGRSANCHPSALRLDVLPTPPRFQSVEQAQAWLDQHG